MTPKTDVDPLEAYRRARFWFAVFIVLNVVTSLEIQQWVMIWWPLLLAFFHLGRAEASS
jgi:hypothetical protein